MSDDERSKNSDSLENFFFEEDLRKSSEPQKSEPQKPETKKASGKKTKGKNSEGAGEKPSKGASSSSDAKKKKKLIQTLCIALAVVAVVVALLLIIPPIVKKVDKAISEDLPAGYVTYNASRYFFRIDYPEGWNVANDTAGYGFLQDKEKGLVVTIAPKESAGEEGTDEPENNDINDIVEKRDEMFNSASARFYYRGFEDDKVLDSKAAFTAFSEELKAGLLIGDGDESVEINIGKATTYSGLNETFYKADISYKIKATVKLEADIEPDGESDEAASPDELTETKEVIKSYKGTVYVSARSMAYCAAVIVYDTEDAALYTAHKDEFKAVIDSFRFSVFED